MYLDFPARVEPVAVRAYSMSTLLNPSEPTNSYVFEYVCGYLSQSRIRALNPPLVSSTCHVTAFALLFALYPAFLTVPLNDAIVTDPCNPKMHRPALPKYTACTLTLVLAPFSLRLLLRTRNRCTP